MHEHLLEVAKDMDVVVVYPLSKIDEEIPNMLVADFRFSPQTSSGVVLSTKIEYLYPVISVAIDNEYEKAGALTRDMMDEAVKMAIMERLDQRRPEIDTHHRKTAVMCIFITPNGFTKQFLEDLIFGINQDRIDSGKINEVLARIDRENKKRLLTRILYSDQYASIVIS